MVLTKNGAVFGLVSGQASNKSDSCGLANVSTLAMPSARNREGAASIQREFIAINYGTPSLVPFFIVDNNVELDVDIVIYCWHPINRCLCFVSSAGNLIG